MVKTRVAPSPTGDPHIGTAYTALFNYAFAKKSNGKFVLRIEDTDRTRFIKDSEAKIIDSLKWLGLFWDEGPIKQSGRLKLYKKAAQNLIDNGQAYYCDCSPQRLERLRSEQQEKKQAPRYDGKCRRNPPKNPKEGSVVVRLKVPEEGETSFEDLVRGKITFRNKDIDDAVILKSDSWPTYHLAVVVDDSDMKISHVIRAEEWLSSTPKHVLLYKALGKNLPIFAHLPLLRNRDKSKISKRKNPISLIWYQEQGFLPEAILNYLGLMGWSMPDSREKFTLEEFIENFDQNRVDPAGPVFDLQKLEWLNGEWIRSLGQKQLAKKLKAFSTRSIQDIERILPLVQERLKKLSEFDGLTGYFFETKVKLDKETILQKGKSAKQTGEALLNIGKALKDIDWEKDDIETTIKREQEKIGWSNKDLFQTIRVAVTGSLATPPLFETLEA